jgi:hypothetical protein
MALASGHARQQIAKQKQVQRLGEDGARHIIAILLQDRDGHVNGAQQLGTFLG